jgi:hypothetical protein
MSIPTKNLLISCDYDGTIVNHDFPNIGQPKAHAFAVLKALQSKGYRLILNTCREDETDNSGQDRQFLTDAVEHCRQNGVEFVSINENLPDDDFRLPTAKRRKVYASVYIDDRNLGGFPGWQVVCEQLIGHEYKGRRCIHCDVDRGWL